MSNQITNVEPDHKAQFLSAHDAYADALFRQCYFRVYDRELAKDLVQEAFCRTWTYLAKGKKIENIRAFLYRVVNNLIVDAVRKKKPLSLDELTEEGFSLEDKSSPDMEKLSIGKEVFQMLGMLEESYRTVVMMRFIDELSPKEIAHALGISENVVSVRIHRGIRKLHQLTEKQQ